MTMTKKEFAEVCSLQESGLSVTIGYQEFNMTGKLIGCWGEYLVIDVGEQQALWPREVCNVKRRTYHTPSYA